MLTGLFEFLGILTQKLGVRLRNESGQGYFIFNMVLYAYFKICTPGILIQ